MSRFGYKRDSDKSLEEKKREFDKRFSQTKAKNEDQAMPFQILCNIAGITDNSRNGQLHAMAALTYALNRQHPEIVTLLGMKNKMSEANIHLTSTDEINNIVEKHPDVARAIMHLKTAEITRSTISNATKLCVLKSALDKEGIGYNETALKNFLIHSHLISDLGKLIANGNGPKLPRNIGDIFENQNKITATQIAAHLEEQRGHTDNRQATTVEAIESAAKIAAERDRRLEEMSNTSTKSRTPLASPLQSSNTSYTSSPASSTSSKRSSTGEQEFPTERKPTHRGL